MPQAVAPITKPPAKPSSAKASKPVTSPATTAANPAKPQSLHVGRELVDTTWRMAVPIVGMALVGIALDLAFGSKPWLTIGGSVVGFYFAMQLIKRQINKGTK